MPDRSKTHGEYADYCVTARKLKELLIHSPTRHNHSVIETYDQICGKIARIAEGSESFKDHWVDIRGYAKCMERSLLTPCSTTRTYDADFLDEALEIIGDRVSRGRRTYLSALFKILSFLAHPDYTWTCRAPWCEIPELIDEYFTEYHSE